MLKRKEVTIILHTAIRDPCFGKAACGFCAVIDYKGHRKFISNGEARAKRTEFELKSAITTFEALNQPCKVLFITTSKSLFQTVKFLNYYAKRDFIRKDNAPLRNKELIQQLYEVAKEHYITSKWQKNLATTDLGVSCITIASSLAVECLQENS